MKRVSDTTIHDCSVVELGSTDKNGETTTVVEYGASIPFKVERIYYLYRVPGDQSRGGHAHKALRQLVVAVCGSFEVVLDDGTEKKTVLLCRPDQGLLIVPGIWRELENFSPGAVCLVLASLKYDEADYIRDSSIFLEYKKFSLG